MLPFPGAVVRTFYKQRGTYWSLGRANGKGLHTGVDFPAAEGTPLFACAGGRVVTIDYTASYGWRVGIESMLNGELGRDYYCHQPSRKAIVVDVGDQVDAGDRIGAVGKTGNVTGPHLHLERRVSPFSFSLACFRDPRPLLATQPSQETPPMPQQLWYPKASRAQDFSAKYKGDVMATNCLILHSTEGWSWPSYSGGAAAPHMTIMPNFTTETVEVRQHFPLNRSARALVNAAGGVETNTANCFQIELVGTCDPNIHKKGPSKHIYMPDPPDWFIRGIADVVRWLDAQCPKFEIRDGAPRGWVGPEKSPARVNAPQRMTAKEWNSFYGIAAHQHVPENGHWDVGAFPIKKLIAAAKGQTPTPDPTPQPEPPKPTGDTHTVKAGDTLWGIAAATKVTVDNLRKWNGISDANVISVGQVLRLKAPATPPPVPVPDPTQPPPAPPTVEESRFLGENLWADYGAPSYPSRLDELERTRDEVRASVVLGCESGNYVDGQMLNRYYGWGGDRAGAPGVSKDEASFILHSGDDVRISTSIHQDRAKHRILDEGWDHTLKSSTHDGITWEVKQHRLSGVVSVVGVLHCVPWPIGANDEKAWNDQRYKEVAAGLEVLNDLRAKVAKDRKLEVVPGVLGEDFNGKRTDSKYPGGDGPGRAAKDKGWTDAFVPAKLRLPAGSVGTKALIDRILVTLAGVTVREHIIVPTRKGTDHDYAVGVALDLTNRKA